MWNIQAVTVKKGPTVVLSTCEAEYMALAGKHTRNCISYSYWIWWICASSVYEDSQGGIALSKNPVCGQKCKHEM